MSTNARRQKRGRFCDSVRSSLEKRVPPIQNFADPVTVTANGLAPATYTCTIGIDP
jgi:hypothetical protein